MTTLTPLKTVLEMRTETPVVDFYAVKVPAILGNKSFVFNDHSAIDVHHLRRFVRVTDLQSQLKSTLLASTNNVTYPPPPAPSELYLLVGPIHSIQLSELMVSLLEILHATRSEELTVLSVKVPRLPPTSYEQAVLWSKCYWPTVYRKNNLFGPQPGVISRAETDIRRDVHIWMEMAIRVATRSKSSGCGEAIGAIVVKRGDQGSEAIALASDRRWAGQQHDKVGSVMAHAVMRVIDMVAQKLYAAQQKGLDEHLFVTTTSSGVSDFCDTLGLHDPEEKVLLETDNLSPGGYLCHGLELFITHEPCVMCSMALLHSRFSRVVIGRRMPRTGGLSSEARLHTTDFGYGLFWRRELNWSFLAWQLGVNELGLVPILSLITHV